MISDNVVERRRYDLLKALQETDPQCQILKDEIAPIEEAHNWEWRDPLLPGLIIGDPVVVTSDPFTLSGLRDSAAEELVNRLIRSQRQHQPRGTRTGSRECTGSRSPRLRMGKRDRP